MVGMKQGSNPRRGRSRGGNGGKRHQPSRNQAHDSNGPEGKVRGSAQQVHEKYLSLARDATSAGEHIAAEGYYQFAEHYYRIFNADGANNQSRNQQQSDDQQASDQQPNNQQSHDQQQSDQQPNDHQQSDQKRGGDQQNEAVNVVSEDDIVSKGDEKPKPRRNSRKPRTDSGPPDFGDDATTSVEVAQADPEVSDTESVENSDDPDLAVLA